MPYALFTQFTKNALRDAILSAPLCLAYEMLAD